VVTAADSEQAELTLRESALAARRAEREYQFTRVIAPFAGLVTQRQTRPGRMVEVGNPLFRVSAQSPLLVSVHVPESAATQVGVGIGAEVVGLDGTRGDAQVIRASPMLDGASGTREVVLRVPSGPGFAPGASVQVRLPGDRGPAVVIPADLVTADGHVLVQAGDRTVLRAVRLGEALPDGRVVITQGLAAGERVVRR
jgi:RND family efflux transporter MFP subunit